MLLLWNIFISTIIRISDYPQHLSDPCSFSLLNIPNEFRNYGNTFSVSCFSISMMEPGILPAG